jgi:hypothetical protein
MAMTRLVLIVLILALAAAPAAAELNTYYAGTVLRDGKMIPATAQFSVEPGRVAMILKDAKTSSRMLFVEKEHVLRIVDDTGKNYFDIAKGQAASPAAQMQEQMAHLPPAQRQMAEQMMKGMLGAATPVPDTYVWSQEKKTIGGYECTRVDVMQGTVKKAEYWGTPSPDFRMSEKERASLLAMQEYLRNYMIAVRGGSGGSGERAFQWDTSVDGYPIVSRCFNGDQMSLDLQLQSFDRKEPSGDLFQVPKGYKKQDFGMGSAGGH